MMRFGRNYLAFILMILILNILFINGYCQTLIVKQCTFTPGANFNCRQYCQQYFSGKPQMAWYNISSHLCQPMLACKIPFNVYDYTSNLCYVDRTLQKLAPSYFPQSMQTQIIITQSINLICMNGDHQKNGASMATCSCYTLWTTSGKVDPYGMSYACDQPVPQQYWKNYFLNDLIIGPNNTILMYGIYTPNQLQLVYSQLLVKQAEQTAAYILKYQNLVMDLISSALPQEPIIRSSQIWYIVGIFVICYIVFALSYLRFQSQVIKVTKEQFIQKIKSIIQRKDAFQVLRG